MLDEEHAQAPIDEATQETAEDLGLRAVETGGRLVEQQDLRIGDVFIQGGSPGHAMIVVDAARSADGRTAMLLAQSYMPAQEVHVVRNLRHPELGAWFILEGDDRLYTPEWTFDWRDRLHWAD